MFDLGGHHRAPIPLAPLPLRPELRDAWLMAAGHAQVAAGGLLISAARADGREREAVTCHAINELLAGVGDLAAAAGFGPDAIAIHPDLSGFLEQHR